LFTFVKFINQCISKLYFYICEGERLFKYEPIIYEGVNFPYKIYILTYDVYLLKYSLTTDLYFFMSGLKIGFRYNSTFFKQ